MKKHILVAVFLITGLYSALAQCTANAGPNQTLTCAISTVLLQGTSNAPNATYAWSGPGGFTSTEQNPAVTIAGVYALTITDPSDGCTATSSTMLLENITPPTVTASGGILNCNVTSINLNIVTTPLNTPWDCFGPQFFTWPAQPVVTQPGVYTITATDPANGCTSTATVIVEQDVNVPIATATGGTLSCVQPTVTLSGAGSSTGPEFSYIWSTPDGQFISGTTTLNPVVNVPGTYTLLVTNTANGCTGTAQATVTQTGNPPDVNASGGEVGCTPANITLTASSNVPGAVFTWNGPNAFNTNVQNPVIVNATTIHAGIYTVTVTNVVNGCTATATAVVTIGPDVPRVTGSITSPNCNAEASGSIVLAASGGTQPYLYAWSGPGNFVSNSKDISNLIAGIYALTITDGVGCSNVQSFTVAQPALLVLSATVTSTSCPGSSDGSIAIAVSGGNGGPGGAFAYIWSNGSPSNVLFGVPAGTYSVTVVDTKGCTATLTAKITEPEPISISHTIICESGVSVQVSGGTPPYLYIWRMDDPNGPIVANTNIAENLTQGVYYLFIIDSKGCSLAASPITISTGNNTPCTRITGRIIADENANCTADALEANLGNRYVQAIGPNGTFYGTSNASGDYVISLEPGNYVVSYAVSNSQTVVCQNNIAVSLLQAGDTEQVDFLVQHPDPDCPAVSVNVTTSILRRCFNTNYYYIHYCNDGPGTAPDAYVDFTLDPFMTIVTTSQPYTDLGNKQFRFQLGDLAPNDCGNFWIRTEISCDAVLGQTHCSTAQIHPHTPCDPLNPNWSGALVEVKSECAGDSLDFILKNVGTGNMEQPLEYIVIEDGIMTLQGSAAALQAGQSMTVSVPANGATWRIEAKQEPLAPVQAEPVLSVEGCTTTGSFSTGFVNQFALNDEDPWIDENCMPNVGSFDPNDKQGFPVGFGAKHYIRPGTELEYLIRFQNTGTDTAFTVVIRDTLSEWLDPLTVQPGAGSHPFRFTLAGEGVLIFDFQNILLPDSNVNEAASHGFVQFRIRPRADVPLETDIFNKAAIYFDFNDPVITNTTVHRIGENFLVGLWQPEKPEYTVSISPHPLTDASWITVAGLTADSRLTGSARLSVFDLTGRPVRTLSAPEPHFLLRKNDLPEGTYLFKVEVNGVIVGNGKLLVF